MADYKASDVVGNKWTRAFRVSINNQLNSPPTICFEEEEVINLDGDQIRKPSGSVQCVFDPENLAHVSLYNQLNDLYVLLREERDLRPAVVPLTG